MKLVAVTTDQQVFRSGETRRITATILSVAADGTVSKVAATSVSYLLYRQGAAGAPLSLITSGVMADVSGGAGTDWEASITFASANAHLVEVTAVSAGLPVDELGGVRFVPPKPYFDPTELFM